MALIKCEDCGKEISDKADKCIHCGCPVGQKKTVSVKIKSWDELSGDEVSRIIHYRKINHEYTNIESLKVFFLILVLVCGIVFFIGLISDVGVVGGIGLLGMPICFVLGIIFSFLSIYEQKEWYERNKERVYKDKFLPLI